MIAIQKTPPLVQLEDGTLATLEKSWLRHGITHAAHQAGYRKWWLADHIGAGVMEYFSQRVDERIVPLERIVEAVRAVLSATGYKDVAAHFCPPPMPVRIDLRHIAQSAGTGGELVFFSMLDTELASLSGRCTRHLRVEGLKEATKTLLGAHAWRRDCEKLSDEIVTHVRNRLNQYRGRKESASQPFLLRIS